MIAGATHVKSWNHSDWMPKAIQVNADGSTLFWDDSGKHPFMHKWVLDNNIEHIIKFYEPVGIEVETPEETEYFNAIEQRMAAL